ncbi:hypothetical protein ASG37_02105 [Sphingomonas sp. Leaf407]|uniref:SMI1/KNR4 family protein n=1 Tax=unclassified Sphingomonas TaxID=196159 RepID=UPI0006F97B85|nr:MULTISPECIES: SMI1/KNR4 family protein [unclassified Sphingomonas]KQN40603.1 hypothetical protein ASE97_02130 [Sphingomonas sp. Leaf42]KQT29959.1 hypothetical protein ASG37_02105 [Sphingomonas sp. Leaf407]
MGWLARLFGRERRKPFEWFKVDRSKAQPRPVAPLEAADDPGWAWRTLVAWWDRTRSDIPIGGASDEAIETLERRYDIVLPPDFRAYLTNAIPSREEEMDAGMGTWWHLDRIRNLPDEYEHPVGPVISDGGRPWLFFVDHLIWSWAWAICCEPGPDWGKVAVILSENDDCIVAASFSDFVAGYIADPYDMT